MQEKINLLKNLILKSVSIKENEKENIMNFVQNNPEKIDDFIKIFSEEKQKIESEIIKYLDNK